ncbi:MAG: hypothetical protein LBS82_04875 [Spirochaetaceae bacterium]|jgi:XTP/dITP diphosphohydrolase|nr:hypothetical protein [Spirochaetaceae bacterium]
MGGKIVVSFLTKNAHKFIEAREALAAFPHIALEQIAAEKPEYKDDEDADPIRKIAERAAAEAVLRYGVPLVAEDAGIFFNAYPGFPGLNTKWLMKRIGYEGVFRLLAGKDRAAYFRSALAFRTPQGTGAFFEGRLEGRIAERVEGEAADCMDYDRIFIPAGAERPFSLMMDEKMRMSHRKMAFHKLGVFLSARADG